MIALVQRPVSKAAVVHYEVRIVANYSGNKWGIETPYFGEVGILLHKKRKDIVLKSKLSYLSYIFVMRWLLSINLRWKYYDDAEEAISVVSSFSG